MVFYGEYEVSFSAPGRVVLPKKIRELLTGTSFVLTRGFDLCLTGYDHVLWQQKAGEVGSASTLLEQQDMKKRRFIFSSAAIVEIDEQGRFVIPKNLLVYARLDRKIIIAGVGDHFELWNCEQWKMEMA